LPRVRRRGLENAQSVSLLFVYALVKESDRPAEEKCGANPSLVEASSGGTNSASRNGRKQANNRQVVRREAAMDGCLDVGSATKPQGHETDQTSLVASLFMAI